MTSKTLKSPSGLEFEQPIGLFIDNEYHTSKETLPVVDPATGEKIVDVYAASEEDIDTAVKSARKAFKKEWKYSDGHLRRDLLLKLADLLLRDKEVVANIEAWDSGKVYHTEATINVEIAATVYKYYAGWADKAQGGKTIDAGKNKFAYTLHEPWGVCGQIIPWNYPLLMAAWKIAPAVAAGNTVVLKTAENTPLSMAYFGKLVVEAGFPPGVINIVTGLGRTAGSALAGHMDVDKVAFTGSTATGRVIMKLAASSNLKNVTLELGGKSPMIIFNDVEDDLDKVVQQAHFGIMLNQGQICTAMSRLLVHESIYDEFLKRYVEQVQKVSKVGSPFDSSSFQGPQVSDVQQQRVMEYVKSGSQDGARLLTGGKTVGKGFFVEPTVFADVEDHMKIMREEIFGPVVSISKFSTEEEAIFRANDTSYGLGASIFTRDITRAHRLARELEAGQIWINSANDSDCRVPFGGYKSSGIGRELGEYGLQAYTQPKAVHVNMTF